VNERYLGWVKDLINVPVTQFAGYTNSKLKLIPEPAAATQQTYAALDPVVQKILTDKNADIKQTLDSAAQSINGILAQASR
jgi:hypothetical protein